jgi:hypothetical protein
MRFSATDVVVRLSLDFEAVSWEEALEKCRQLIAELRPVKVSAREARFGGSRRYMVTMVSHQPSSPGEGAANALRRVALAILGTLHLGEEYLDVEELGGRLVARALVMGPKLVQVVHPDCTVVDLLAEMGCFGPEPLE